MNIYEPPGIFYKPRWQIHRPIPMHHAARLANAMRQERFVNPVSFTETYLRGMFTAIATDNGRVACVYIQPALWRRCAEIHLQRNPKATFLAIGGYHVESDMALLDVIREEILEKTVWTPDQIKASEELFI